MNTHTHISVKTVRIGLMALLLAILFGGASTFRVQTTSANHPVLVEGNCDSPVPGTTVLPNAGTCGDYDGDGRIGTAEDTDGADRIFGTLTAALGPGTGAAAGTGANQNGRITIVKSGRFAEQLVIGFPVSGIPGQGSMTPGNVTIEAAPGVEANIDAVLQGDPAGGNNTRQGQPGIIVNMVDATRVVQLRNLVLRNWTEGIRHAANGRLLIDKCRIEHNINHGVRTTEASLTVITNSQINGNGYRVGTASGTAAPGNGVTAEGASQVRISDSTIAHNFGTGIANNTGGPGFISVFQTGAFFNNGGNTSGSIGLNNNNALAQ
ncbi:MAG TPA: right-handed parallel beta-helix repeat-containing protein [Pyrinomonadaceae bacterium]|nr:right-handed parallel beta-helix repeat-containing protein [Pyrinomonadaceae bacterium]